jgi:hypothetical protein
MEVVHITDQKQSVTQQSELQDQNKEVDARILRKIGAVCMMTWLNDDFWALQSIGVIF